MNKITKIYFEIVKIKCNSGLSSRKLSILAEIFLSFKSFNNLTNLKNLKSLKTFIKLELSLNNLN